MHWQTLRWLQDPKERARFFPYLALALGEQPAMLFAPPESDPRCQLGAYLGQGLVLAWVLRRRYVRLRKALELDAACLLARQRRGPEIRMWLVTLALTGDLAEVGALDARPEAPPGAGPPPPDRAASLLEALERRFHTRAAALRATGRAELARAAGLAGCRRVLRLSGEALGTLALLAVLAMAVFGRPPILQTRLERTRLLLAHALPAWVAAREHKHAAAIASARETLLASAAFAPALAASLRAAVDAGERDRQTFMSATAALNAELEHEGVPFVVEAVPLASASGELRPLLLSYEITERRAYQVGETVVTALLVRRLDHLTAKRAALGRARPGETSVLVLMDDIEAFVVETLLPLFDEALPEVNAAETTYHARHVALATKLAELRRAAVLASFSGDELQELREDLTLLAAAVGRRNEALTRLRDSLERAGFVLDAKPRFLLDDATERALDDLSLATTAARTGVSGGEARAVLDLDAEVRDLSGPLTRVRTALMDLAAEQVCRHEARHVADLAAGLPDVASLAARIPDPVIGERAKLEASAFLAEIIDSAHAPHAAVADAALRVIDARRRLTSHFFASWWLLEELCGRAVMVRSGDFDAAELAACFGTIEALPADALRDRAREVWTKSFGPYAAIVRR